MVHTLIPWQPPKRGARIKAPPPAKRPSKLAKDNGLSAQQEAEIREAFGLFAVSHPEYEEAEEGVLKKSDVRRCLMWEQPGIALAAQPC